MNETASLAVGDLIIGLLGGLAIFLYGMEKMTDGLKIVAGSRLKTLLARMTTNRIKGVLAGTVITAIIQSSSVTTVLVVGFITAGLMSLSQSIGIIMGASIGTTVTAQIIAFKVTKYALVLVAGGFLMSFAGRAKNLKAYGHMTMGLGLVFFGMTVMKDSTSDLQTYQPFIDTMRDLDNPLLAILFSAMFTGLVQSSSATTGVIIVLATQGFIDLETGIALVFGANIGTCVTALLASIGKPREAVRASMVHVLFNTAGVVVWIAFIPYLAQVVEWMSPLAEAAATAGGGGETGAHVAASPRQIANAHTIFNVSATLIFLPFTPLIARAVEFLVPDRKTEDTSKSRRVALNAILVHTPGLALDLVRMEIARLGDAAHGMTEAAIAPVLSGTAEELDVLRDMDDPIDEQHGAIITYLGRLSLEPLAPNQSRRLSDYISAANYLENIGDLIETNIVELGRARIADKVEISPGTAELLSSLHERVLWSVKTATEALASEDSVRAREVLDAKREINGIADEAERRLEERLTADAPNRLAAYRIESDMIEAMKRIYYLAKRVAKIAAEPNGNGREAPEQPAAAEEPAAV